MEKQLKQLGLTNNEIKVYEALINIGESTVGPLCKKLNMHRQVIYDALEGLEKRDMVIRTTKSGRNNYKIADPENVLKKIKYEEKIAKNLIKEINNRLTEKKEIQEIKIYEGADAYREHLIKTSMQMPVGSTVYVITASENEWEEIMIKNKSLDRINKIRSERNIKTKIIYPEKMRKHLEDVKKEKFEARFIKGINITPTEFAISPTSVEFVSFGSSVFIIEVKNKKLRDDYLEHFNKLWKIAKK